MKKGETTMGRIPNEPLATMKQPGWPRAGRVRTRETDGAEERGRGLRRATIMMVDDEPTTLDVLEVFLRGEGYENLVTTSDPTLALELLRSHKPDLLLLDLLMPKLDGLDLLGVMRSDPGLRRIPVIVLTSATEPERKLRALELGASDFLAKPVDPSELALRLRNTLAAKAYLDQLAYFDAVTGLPNRRSFVEGLEHWMQRPGSQAMDGAMLRIDLDRFKQINDAYGHRVGDALLKAVAERLQRDLLSHPPANPIAEGARLCREGTAFLLFLPRTGLVGQAAHLAECALASLADPFRSEAGDVFLTASIGIAVYPLDGEDAETLLANCGIAMAHVKQGGGNDFRFYSQSSKDESLQRLVLENDLRRAIEREELTVHYQPKVDVRSGRIVGAEALARWNHPEHGFVPPDRFIPIAEECGVIDALGTWVLRAACQQASAWQAAGRPPIPLSVNVSSRQFRSGRLAATVRAALEESGISGSRLVLEVTESLLIEDPERIIGMLRELKQLGVRISVDDFGTGYSSLSYLKRLPLDELKVDKSFVRSVPGDADDAAIVSAVIALAHNLGRSVVAEGVETREQLAFLLERGCDQFQGYLFAAPAPSEGWDLLFEKDAATARRVDES
jgi:diguanylate cyclase (GGDEF)-like protein